MERAFRFIPKQSLPPRANCKRINMKSLVVARWTLDTVDSTSTEHK